MEKLKTFAQHAEEWWFENFQIDIKKDCKDYPSRWYDMYEYWIEWAFAGLGE